jgi:FlaA1/EpsC-like NDP-sugar epimerase
VQFRRQLLLKTLKLTDLFLMSITFMLVTWVFYAHDNNIYVFDEFLEHRIKIENAILAGAMVLAWHIVFSSFGLYESKRFSNRTAEMRDIIIATLAGTSVMAAMTVVFSIEMVSLGFLPVFWIVVTALTCLSRICLRIVLGWIRLRGRNLRNVLIVGTNQWAAQFAHDITEKPELGYRLLGFADDRWEGLTQWNQKKFPLVASLETLPAFLRSFAVDEVLITLPMRSYYQPTSHIAAQCEEQGILVRVLGELFTPKLAKPSVDEPGRHSTLTLHTGAIGDQAIFIKRIFSCSCPASASSPPRSSSRHPVRCFLFKNAWV